MSDLKIVEHSWNETGIYLDENRLAAINIEDIFDVTEDNQRDCESVAKKIAVALMNGLARDAAALGDISHNIKIINNSN